MAQKGKNKDLQRDKPITSEDINKYIEQQSDFAFEMDILQMINQTACKNTNWGGLYHDIYSGKQRQFDIRTELMLTKNKWAKLAIECKHLKDCYPLVVSCAPRTKDECYLNYWLWSEPEKNMFNYYDTLPQYKEQIHKLSKNHPTGSPLGRSLSQVGKDKDEKIISSDSEVFEKWTQALASLHSCLEDALSYNAADDHIELYFLPIVVVPDGTLWSLEYETNGSLKNPPTQVLSIPYYVNINYFVRNGCKSEHFQVSHLYFFTKTGLQNFLTQYDIHGKILGNNDYQDWKNN